MYRIFCPQQAQLLAIDLLTYATADDTPQRFLHAEPEDIAPHARHLKALLPY